MKKLSLVLTVLMIAALMGCGGNGSQGAQGKSGPIIPVIQSLSIAGLPAHPGSTVIATVSASAQGLALTYTWTVSSGWIVAADGNSPTATITAPNTYGASGTATIEISDIQGGNVTGSIALSTKGNSMPVINSISASPNPVLPNATVTASVKALDPDGDDLVYTWAITPGWTITGYGATATALAPATYNTGGHITVTVNDDYGSVVTGTIAVGTFPLASPTNLTVTTGYPRTGLAWSALTDATSYRVYDSTISGGPYSAVGTTTTTGYTVTGLANNITYYFVVTALDSNGESGYSNQVSTIRVAHTFTVGSNPYAIAIDASGNVWVSNNGYATVTELSSSGISIGTYFVGNNPTGIAIGGINFLPGAGEVVVAGSNITWLRPNGIWNGDGYTYNIQGMTLDISGNIWISVVSNNPITYTIYKIYDGSNIGTYSVGFPPRSMATDVSGNVWVISDLNDVVEFNSNGTIIGTYPVVTGSEGGIAIDSTGNIWVAGYYYNTVSELSPTGTTIGSFYAGISPRAIAIDAIGNIWVTNENNNTITELNSKGSVIESYNVGPGPIGIAIDASGNVWVANHGANTVTELINITTGPQYFPPTGETWPGGGY